MIGEGGGGGAKNRSLGNFYWMDLKKWTEKNDAHASLIATFVLNYVIYYKLNITVIEFL